MAGSRVLRSPRSRFGAAEAVSRSPDRLDAAAGGAQRRCPETAKDGAHPQDQLRWGERLEDVVVGAEREPAEPVCLVAPGGEEQDADLARFLPAPQLGQH